MKNFSEAQINIKLNMLFKLIGHKIRSDYALIAITCSAFANENNLTSQDSLAIVGDHVIKLIISSRAFNQNSKISKMAITDIYQKLETNVNLEKIGERYNINDLLFSSNTELEGNKKLATSIEAVIGAIYLSDGMDKAILFAKKIELVQK